MAGTRTGTPSIIKHARAICRLVARYGAGDLATVTTTGYSEAVLALVAACALFEALDDFPGQIDATTPIRPGEDVSGA